MTSELMHFPHIESGLSDKSAADRNSDAFASTGDSHASKPIKDRSPVQEAKTKGGSQQKKGFHQKSPASATSEDSTESSGQQQAPGRKKRARSTPEETDANGRKSSTDFGGQRDGSLWLGGEGDGPVQGSLLEEVLAEKKMALLRSPEVIRFLQKRQSLLLVTQTLDSAAMDFNAGEEEEEAGQHSS